MRKGLKALLKTSIAIATSACIIFTSIDSNFLALAEENQVECASYDTIIDTIKSMITGQSNKEAAEKIMRSLSEDEVCQIIDIYNSHVNIDDQYNTVCSLLESRDFDSIKSYIKDNITLSEFDILLSIYINHADDINSFIETYKNSTEEDVEETETEELEQTEIVESSEIIDETEQSEESTEQTETEPTEEETESELNKLVQTELTEAVNGTTISISGNLPEDTELVVTELEDDKVIKNSIEKLNGLATVTVYKSFDISLISKEEEYEPESDNNSVVVTIQCEDSIEDNLTVFHTDDNNNTTEISSTINTDTNIVEFTTESFSVYTIASVTYDTESGVEYTNEYGTGYYYADTKTLLVTAGSSASRTNWYPWYWQKDNIEKVVITGDVTTVPNYVFDGYTKLKNVIMEEGITTIGSRAFSNCTSLSHIVVPASCTNTYGSFIGGCTSLTSASPISSGKGTGYEYGWTDQIPAYAFMSLSKLSEIELIDGIKSIGIEAFHDCISLTEITLPNTVTTIGSQAFVHCSSLTEVILPDTVTTIGDSAFQYCSSLSHIVVPASCTSIGQWTYPVFEGCTALTTASPISSGKGTGYEYGWTDQIPESAFNQLTKLTGIEFTDDIKTIGDYAFDNCSSLTEVIIPDTVTTIGNSAFSNCTSLSHIVVPASCTNIDYTVFTGCTSLTSASPISSGKGTGYEYGWTDQIPANAFYYSDLSEIELIDGIKTIGDSAFYDCISLTEITLPNTVTTIGSQAFDGCKYLTEVVLPDTVTTIGSWAFQYCNNLTTFKIGNGIKTIGDHAFNMSGYDMDFKPIESVDTTVITDNKVVKNYNWSGDNRNVTFQRLTPITDLDVCIPVNNMSFNIDGEKNFSSEPIKIVNNSPCDVDVYITNITGGNNAINIISSQSYTDDEWNEMTEFNNIALMVNNIDLATAYNNSAHSEDKYINLGYIESSESEIDNTLELKLDAKYPRSFEIDTDFAMDYNLTLLFVSQE